jgi:hypothetical protein
MTDLDKVSSYLAVYQILIKIQIVILDCSNTLVFKLLPLFLCVGIFFNPTKALSFKLLLLSLLLCPGFSIYANGIHILVDSIQTAKLGVNLHKELSTIEAKYQKKETLLKSHQQEVKDRQLVKAKSRGKDRIGFFKREVDGVVNKVENTVLKVEKEAKLAEEVLLIDTENLFIHLTELISTLILLIIVLPLLYFYIVTFIVEQLFQVVLDQTLHSSIKKTS